MNTIDTIKQSQRILVVDDNPMIHEATRLIRQWEQKDAARLRQVAHRLNGSAVNVSAEAVRENASRLEELGRDGNLTQAPGLIAQLRSNMESVKQPSA